jgi:hypothetical protein
LTPAPHGRFTNLGIRHDELNVRRIDDVVDVRHLAEADGAQPHHGPRRQGIAVAIDPLSSWPLVSEAVYLRHGLLAPAHHFPHGHVAQKVAEAGVSPQTGNNLG